jgi:glucosamine-6-phosphate deaminase
VPHVPLRIFETPEELGDYVAGRIIRGIDDAVQRGARFLLGLPTGRTPRPVYAAMARQLESGAHSLAHVTLVMMDEYLSETPDGFIYALAGEEPKCHAFTRVEIVGQLNAAVAPAQRLRDDAVWYPDPRSPAAYDERISAAGGLDFFLIASGAGDGHVAFNPPGSAASSRSRVVTLSEQTRRDNLQTFPGLGTLENVPRFGVTVGVSTITAARDAVMVAWGTDKRVTVDRMLAATAYEPDWPATLIHECANVELLVDRAAAP